MSSLLSLAVLPHLSFGSCSFSFPGNESFHVFPWRRPLPSDLCPLSRSPLPLVRLDQLTLLTLPAPSSPLDSSCVVPIRALSDNRALHLTLNILYSLSSPPPTPHRIGRPRNTVQFSLSPVPVEGLVLLGMVLCWEFLSPSLGAFGYFEVTHDITRYSKAKVFEHIGKRTPIAVRFSTVGKSVCFACLFWFLQPAPYLGTFIA